MRLILIALLLTSDAHAITREQGRRIMSGESINSVTSRKPGQAVVQECHNSFHCRHDEYCHKQRESDSKGVCVKKSKD